MPKAQQIASLSGMVESDMEDDIFNQEADALPTPDSNQENGPTKKKNVKGKATAKRFTKPKMRRSGDDIAPSKAGSKSKAIGKKRAPLREQKNVQSANDIEEVDEVGAQANEDTNMDELVEVKLPTKRKAPTKKAGRPPKKATVQPVNAIEKDGEFEYTPTAVRHTRDINKPPAPKAQNPNGEKHRMSAEPQRLEKVIPETQVSEDNETSQFPEGDVNAEAEVPQSVFRRANNARSGRPIQPMARRRASSASDTERAGNDPMMRRRLGEMTRKVETIEMKYKNLKETVAKEGEVNLRKFESNSQAKAKAAEDLVASLRKEISLQKSLSEDSRSLQKQIAARDADLAKTQTLADQLSTSLSEAQNENKALQAKLANARTASTAVESLNARTPGSGMRGKNPAARTIMVGSAEAAQAAQVAQMKEDLYSDLTGLILRGVERGDESDIYDCLQTGPNGTLHFKLAIAKDTDGGYDNTEFQYGPRLDENRDRDLIALLPDYLTEDITFSRTNAAMFYGRVVTCLTRKQPTEVQE